MHPNHVINLVVGIVEPIVGKKHVESRLTDPDVMYTQPILPSGCQSG